MLATSKTTYDWLSQTLFSKREATLNSHSDGVKVEQHGGIFRAIQQCAKYRRTTLTTEQYGLQGEQDVLPPTARGDKGNVVYKARSG